MRCAAKAEAPPGLIDKLCGELGLRLVHRGGVILQLPRPGLHGRAEFEIAVVLCVDADSLSTLSPWRVESCCNDFWKVMSWGREKRCGTSHKALSWLSSPRHKVVQLKEQRVIREQMITQDFQDLGICL